MSSSFFDKSTWVAQSRVISFQIPSLKDLFDSNKQLVVARIDNPLHQFIILDFTLHSEKYQQWLNTSQDDFLVYLPYTVPIDISRIEYPSVLLLRDAEYCWNLLLKLLESDDRLNFFIESICEDFCIDTIRTNMLIHRFYVASCKALVNQFSLSTLEMFSLCLSSWMVGDCITLTQAEEQVENSRKVIYRTLDATLLSAQIVKDSPSTILFHVDCDNKEYYIQVNFLHLGRQVFWTYENGMFISFINIAQLLTIYHDWILQRKSRALLLDEHISIKNLVEIVSEYTL